MTANFNKIDNGFSVKINTRGCNLTNIPLKDIIESTKETGHCLLSLKDGTVIFVRKTTTGNYVIDLGYEEAIND